MMIMDKVTFEDSIIGPLFIRYHIGLLYHTCPTFRAAKFGAEGRKVLFGLGKIAASASLRLNCRDVKAIDSRPLRVQNFSVRGVSFKGAAWVGRN